MKKIKNISILSVISFIAIIIDFIFLLKIDILPDKYLLVIVVTLLYIHNVGISFKNINSRFKQFGKLILILSILINIAGIYYFYFTDDFFNRSFNNKIVYTTTFYIVTNSDNNITAETISDTIYYYENTTNVEDATKYLKKKNNYTLDSYDDIVSLFNDLLNKKINLMLVEKSSYEIIFELDKSLDKNSFKIIDEFDMEYIKEQEKYDGKTAFNIYIGGNDFTNSLMDFNMIVTINIDTHDILLTSMPRDYYIPVAGRDGRRDTLSYMGPYGIDTSVKSLEEFLDIKIDYYVKVNTVSLVELVNAVGGITYCSDISYTTTHALVLNTYNDNGKKLYVKKGCQELNGIETLTVARERNAFPGRDRVRQENCRKIILAIFEKMISTNTIVNYSNILDSLDSLYQTTLPREVISKIAKDTINGYKWNILEQSVDGSDTKDYVHLTYLKDWVMYPDMNTVYKAKDDILNIINKNS